MEEESNNEAPQFHDIQVTTSDKKFKTTIKDVPIDIKVKDFLALLNKIPELEEYGYTFKIVNESGCLQDDDTIKDDAVCLENAEKFLSPQVKNHKKLVYGMFWVLQAILIVSIYYKHVFIGISIYVVGSIILWLLKRFNPENATITADAIDAFRLFFESLLPTFQLEDAAIKRD
ncbi:hypothetical protein TVAG_379400 [Trichomonas vaginalis G3]|uniref:Uncharacterized protein n=1 Tax=Trichomonas vaginalis (strain ATCC PRA-98 / G3) TaxID=412133 RepID=A2E7G5_TRIV3|nr:hypothetical protein TVAGG3_0339460 [Trichomonas vaginalis G3]EAY11358.1 hypothetical protein TVAG_379400 [Trichomonas vaginalis G3]KAI5530523.1 hypothetical protein TVAGG3_0339460 [Trichomonas vaginalis G3]|eukprot:XP_001323581.1 hypothetical protein [Trichomonas vaginalis G3]